MTGDSTSAHFASTVDPFGNEVILLERIWLGKIAYNHPEVLSHLNAVLGAVNNPDRVVADPRPGRMHYYRRGIGPSKWIRVVVSYEQRPARIITAFALRKVWFEHGG